YDILAMNAASAAIAVSPIPVPTHVGAVRIGKLHGDFVVNPSEETYEDLEMDLVVSGSTEAILMVECGSEGVSEVEVLDALDIAPRVHGSALFTRGETQILSNVALGTSRMDMRIDNLGLLESKTFWHHYNFPPFSVGEAGFMRGPKRRDIGHGALAERALAATIPSQEDFPYVVRVVSETLESNGSSSMGSVCASSMALQAAGVPVSALVAGVAMGLIKEGDDHVVLTDIAGVEDHLGDMDFKVAGT